MNVYQAFFTLKSGVHDMDFVAGLNDYMGYLRDRGDLEGWRLLRRKLGLGPRETGEWQLLMEVKDLAQLDQAFGHVATRTGDVEAKHHGVNHMIDSVTFALYRDFPDDVRATGGEKF
ncbi:MAG: DUF6614 family protein [Hyphomicrobiaceae bacterium]